MAERLKIKVCGMKDPGNLEEVCALAPDWVGYIFFRESPRYVGDQPDLTLFSIPAGRSTRVGVFVDQAIPAIRMIVEKGWVDYVQLHGSESPDYCKTLADEGIRVIKALDPEKNEDPRVLEGFAPVVDCFLFDKAGKGYGGTGRKFNWEVLEGYAMPVPFLLGGGIGPDDGPLLRQLDTAGLVGVDVNSRFEDSPGMKNIMVLERFMREIRKNDKNGI
jgi:phosphoribosylanthranilate isomerase